jgi:hypothetical protein
MVLYSASGTISGNHELCIVTTTRGLLAFELKRDKARGWISFVQIYVMLAADHEAHVNHQHGVGVCNTPNGGTKVVVRY